MTQGPRRKPQIIIKAGEDIFEVYALNPGEIMPDFWPGGQSLMVQDTASLVVLRKGPASGTQNTEYGLRDRDFWDWIARLINGVDGVTTIRTEP